MSAVHPTIAFVGQMATHWRETGAVMPSGKRLAQVMARAIGGLTASDVIIELGPGTGVFTRELLAHHPRNRVVAVEFNPHFVDPLRQALPQATVIEGCASHLPRLLAAHGIDRRQVAAVVSGLPLLSLERALAQRVIGAIGDCLRPGGSYIQFTYLRRAWRRFDLSGFDAAPHQRVWLNVPPAVVMPFIRRPG